MKRLEFIKTLSLATLGLSLFPSWVSKNKATIKLVPFPETSEHVRHSGLNLLKNELNSSQTEITSRQILFKNGISTGKGDLTITSLRFKGKELDVFYSDKGISISVDSSYSDLQTPTSNIDGTRFTLIKGQEIFIKNEPSLILILPLTGNLILNGDHKPQHALLLKNTVEQYFKTSSDDAMHLLIS